MFNNTLTRSRYDQIMTATRGWTYGTRHGIQGLWFHEDHKLTLYFDEGVVLVMVDHLNPAPKISAKKSSELLCFSSEAELTTFLMNLVE